jgi:uncharacterized RDD family membrane protein YckC
MADDPVTIVKGGTLAQNLLGSAPEGMLIAPAWKRVLAFMLDVILLCVVLTFLSRGQLIANLYNVGLLALGAQSVAFFIVNWFVFGASFYLYFKYTGQTMGRSLAQRGFRIAIVHDNGTPLESHHWGPRAVGKMVYMIPYIGPLWFGLKDTFNAGSATAEYRTKVDKKHHTVAAVDWSLPQETRSRLR